MSSVVVVFIFSNSLSCLAGFLCVSVFNISVAVCYNKIYEANPASHRHTVGKEKSIFKGFISSYGYFSLMLYKN